jgi:hypothetical protein
MFSNWGWQEHTGLVLALKVALRIGQYDMREPLDILPPNHSRRDRAAAWERFRQLGGVTYVPQPIWTFATSIV